MSLNLNTQCFVITNYTAVSLLKYCMKCKRRQEEFSTEGFVL